MNGRQASIGLGGVIALTVIFSVIRLATRFSPPHPAALTTRAERMASLCGTLEFQRDKFQFDLPPSPWMRRNSSDSGSGALLTLYRHDPDIAFQVHACTDTKLDSATALTRAFEDARKSSEWEYEPGEPARRVIDGVEGLTFAAKYRADGRELWAVIWVGADGTRSWRLTTAGPPHLAAEIESAAEGLQSRFRVIRADAGSPSDAAIYSQQNAGSQPSEDSPR